MCLHRAGCLVAILVAGGIPVLTARAADQADAEKIVARAIEATGGADKLAKAKALTWKESGTYFGLNESRPYTATYRVQYPNRWKLEAESSGATLTMVVNGDKGWRKFEGNDAQELEPERMVEQREDLWADSLQNLLPLKANDCQLSAAGEATIEGRPTLAVKVLRKGYRDVKIYFDKDSGLLVRIEQRFAPAEKQGLTVTREKTFGNFKDVNGVKLPTKYVIKDDGSMYVDATRSDYTVQEKLGDSAFARP